MKKTIRVERVEGPVPYPNSREVQAALVLIAGRRQPLLTAGYCTHRLGTYHGGRV